MIGVVLVGLAGGLPAAAMEHGGKAMSAQEKAMMAKWQASMTPGQQHAEMADMVGTWSVRTTTWMAPGAPPEVNTGTAVRTMMFDGRVLREDFTGNWQGQPFAGVAHTGYDNVTGQYWSTWMDNMMTGVTVMKGRWDKPRGLWIFEGQAPDPMAGGLIPLRIESRMEGDDREVDVFFKPGPDGRMFRMMELVYERQ